MSDERAVIVVGGGLAGARSVEALRELGFAGALTLASGEPVLPYERPPLSKAYLAGATPSDAAIVHPADWYATHGVDFGSVRPPTPSTLTPIGSPYRTAPCCRTRSYCWPPARCPGG